MTHSLSNTVGDAPTGAAEPDYRQQMICPLCGGTAHNRYHAHPGYSAAATYDIYHCADCVTAFADPMRGETGLYDCIYSNYRRIPGYLRYAHYAQAVRSSKDPLSYLAGMEGAYWSVAKTLERYGDDRSINILEIGSGSGYLTYAIAKRDFTITGLDVSSEAVSTAKRLYGDHYACADLFEYSRTHRAQYDLVIMTEVIEHVDAPRAFLAAAEQLLKPGGRILVTTPDRGAFPAHAVWQTEYPPVHYWWFTARSFAELAEQLNLSLSFVDITGAPGSMPVNPDHVGDGLQPDRAVVFLDRGRLNPALRRQVRAQRLYYALHRIGLVSLVRRAKQAKAATPRAAVSAGRPYCLCAVFTKRRDASAG